VQDITAASTGKMSLKAAIKLTLMAWDKNTPCMKMNWDKHINKFKRVMRHIKMISMNRRLFWMNL
jgi:hypothetical protein